MPDERWSLRWGATTPLVVLTLWFCVTRIAYTIAGVRFDTALVRGGFQYVDPSLLRSAPLDSIYYLHAQPPLLNVVTLIGLRSPIGLSLSLHLLFLTLGLCTTLALFLLLRELSVAEMPALLVAAGFMATPSVVLYENWYYATYLVFAGLVVTGWCVARFFRRGSFGALIGAFGGLALIALTRSTFHLAVVAALGLLIVAFAPRGRRRAASVVLVLALIVVGSWYVKNWVEFGSPTASSWFGMNLAKLALYSQPPGRVAGDVDAGRLGHLAEIPPFSPVGSYPGLRHTPTGVAVLDRRWSSGWPNYNNIAYIKISDRYLDQAVRFIRAHPGWYLEMVGASFRYAGTGSATYPYLARNATHVAPLLRAEERLLGQTVSRSRLVVLTEAYAPSAAQVEWLVAAAYLLAVAAAVVNLGMVLVRRRGPEPVRATVIFLGAVVAAGLLANLVELGENMRFRFETDGIVVAVTASIVAAGIRRTRARRAARRASPGAGVVPAT